jgi:CBS domain-containing protein
MNVEQCMTKSPRTCFEGDSLESAARIMWETDCGSVPVVDSASRLVGIITDRDACMAAYTQGAPLHAIRLSSAMAKQVFTCGPKDTIESVEQRMGTHRVRRLPVVDGQRRVVGILSLGDLARKSTKSSARASLGSTLASISEPHTVTAAERILAAQPALAPRRASHSSSSKSPTAKSSPTRSPRSKAKSARRSR